MTTLASTQMAFQNWLLDKTEAGPEVNNPEGLKIYHHAYRARIREALGETFEKTWSWIGDEAFDRAVADYIRDHPPTARSLDRCGERLAGVLAKRFPDDPEIAEIAQIEWALHICFSGPDAEPVDLPSVANIDWDAAKIILVPTYTERCFRTNAAALWRALDHTVEPPPCAMLPLPVQHRFWRKALTPHFAAMDAVEARALTLIRQGQSFGAVCETLSQDYGDQAEPAQIGILMGSWFRDQLIAAIVT
jgi:Putative DNA-binding domain